MSRRYTNLDMDNNSIINCSNLPQLREMTEQECMDLFNMTEEEIDELKSIISDNIISSQKLWSSMQTNTEIQKAISQSNKYSDSLLTSISTINLEYINSKADVTSPSPNVIYILEVTNNSIVTHTMNLYKSSTSEWIEIGSIESGMSFTNYYTKTEIDDKLKLKADLTQVVKQDDVVQNLNSPTTSTVISTTGLKSIIDGLDIPNKTIADVAPTLITLPSKYFTSDTKAYYEIRNGICHIIFMTGNFASDITEALTAIVIASDLPKPTVSQVPHTFIPWAGLSSDQQVIMFVNRDRKLYIHTTSNIANACVYTSFSYPVAES